MYTYIYCEKYNLKKRRINETDKDATARVLPINSKKFSLFFELKAICLFIKAASTTLIGHVQWGAAAEGLRERKNKDIKSLRIE